MRAGPPVRRARRQKSQKTNFHNLWDSCAQNKTSENSKNTCSGFRGLLCAEQNVGHINKCTFRISGTPVRRTNLGNLNKNARLGIMGLLCAEQDVGNLKITHFQETQDSCAQNKTSEISKNDFQDFWDACAQLHRQTWSAAHAP